MQTLQKKQKIAISIGVTTVIAMIGIAITLISSGISDSIPPEIGMPVPGSNIPEMIETPDGIVSSGMPVPGSNIPEMIETPDGSK